jgi:[ribosomal protein S5]-alanine N-acetyltransferase
VRTALALPRLDGAPLVLRAFIADDAAAVAEAGTDPLIPLITTVPRAPADRTAVSAFIARQHERASSGQGYSFAIADAKTDGCLGQIGLWPLGDGRASVGYWVVACARRRGVARRALQVVSSWGLALPGLHRLELYVEPWNEGSWRAAEGSGYTREGLLRSWQTVGDQRRDMYMYSRLRTGPPTSGR